MILRLALRPLAHHNGGQDGHLDDPLLVPGAEIPAPEKAEAVSPHTPHKEAPGQVGSDISCTPPPQSTGQGSGDVVGPEATHRAPSAVASGDPEWAPNLKLGWKLLKLGPLRARGQEVPPHMFYRERGYQGCLWPVSQPPAPFSSWTYPVLARVALTPTHTATKMAGRPVGRAGQSVRGSSCCPLLCHSPHPWWPRLSPPLSLTPLTLGKWAACWHSPALTCAALRSPQPPLRAPAPRTQFSPLPSSWFCILYHTHALLLGTWWNKGSIIYPHLVHSALPSPKGYCSGLRAPCGGELTIRGLLFQHTPCFEKSPWMRMDSVRVVDPGATEESRCA